MFRHSCGRELLLFCIGSEIRRGSGNQPLAISSILAGFYAAVIKLKEIFTQI